MSTKSQKSFDKIVEIISGKWYNIFIILQGGENMEEMKAMLVKLCDNVKTLCDDVKRLDKGQDEIRKEICAVEGKLSKEICAVEGKLSKEICAVEEKLSKEICAVEEKLSKEIYVVEEKLFKEIHAVNERLAACQLVNGKKVDVLFDADETRKQLLEIHDEEIPEIKSTLFNYDIRIKNLESKVIGA